MIWKWFKILAPPLLILLFLRVPLDAPTGPFWFAVFAAFFVASYQLLKWLAKSLYRVFKQQPIPFETKRIRSLLTVIIFTGVMFCHKVSSEAADEYAHTLGQSMQTECASRKQCALPEEVRMKGVANDSPAGDWRMTYGKWGPPLRIVFKISKDQKEFSIVVRHNIDSVYIVSGGVLKSLSVESRIS